LSRHAGGPRRPLDRRVPRPHHGRPLLLTDRGVTGERERVVPTHRRLGDHHIPVLGVGPRARHRLARLHVERRGLTLGARRPRLVAAVVTLQAGEVPPRRRTVLGHVVGPRPPPAR